MRDHIAEGDPKLLAAAFLATIASYLFRARRWQYFFLSRVMNFPDSVRVLFLGFLMNNVLPARAGELVRAHMGARISGQSRTLVLASVACERLADGLTLSLLFVLFALRLGDADFSRNLGFVSLFFLAAGVAVVLLLVFRTRVFALAHALHARFDHRASAYTYERFQTFINGLAPLYSARLFPIIALWSVAVWLTELSVYVLITQAFGADLPLEYCVLFMVVVNFSSLVPSAPGGIGVIEAFASAVLVSLGVARPLAVTMVVTQHIWQYVAVGIPGALVLLTWRARIEKLQAMLDDKE